MSKIFVFLYIALFLVLGTGDLICQEVVSFEADTAEINNLRQRIDAHPSNDTLLLALGNIYLKHMAWNDAERWLKECVSVNPDNAIAQNNLGYSYFRQGESPIIPIEKIKKLFKVDNYSKAERHFKQAIELDDNYLEAYYNLGINYLAKDETNDYESATVTFQKLLNKDPSYRDADYHLGESYRFRGEYGDAEKVYRELIEKNRFTGKTNIRLSEVLMELDRKEEAVIHFYQGILNLEDRDLYDEIYKAMRVLLEPEEIEKIESAPFEEEKKLVVRFWKEKDPTPTTTLNERYNTHFDRVKYARETYPALIPPYYDDRGRIYVKYGEPDNKYTSKMYSERIKWNESWTYEQSLGEGMVFDFVKEGHSYLEVQSLEDAAMPGEEPLAVAINLYTERASLSPSYQKLVLGGDPNNRLIDYRAKRNHAIMNAPAEVFNFSLKGNPLPFFYNFARFKESNNKIRTEVYLGVPNQNLTFKETNKGYVESNLHYIIMIQDTMFDDVKWIKKDYPLRGASLLSVQEGMIINQENISLPPGAYRLVIRIDNPEGDARMVYTHPFTTEEMVSQDLLLSDIEMASSITADGGEGEGAFYKNGLKIIPYPYNILKITNPISVYFDVYNLSYGVSGDTRYTVTYEFKMTERKRRFLGKALNAIGSIFSRGDKSLVSSSYTNSGSDRNTHEYLTFDLYRFTEGLAELKITIKDLNTEREASRVVPFSLVQ